MKEVEICEKDKFPIIQINEKGKYKIAIILSSAHLTSDIDKDYLIPKSLVEFLTSDIDISLVFITYNNVEKQLKFHKPNAIICPGGSFAVPHLHTKKDWKKEKYKRGATYLKVLSYSQKKKLPTLCICAGMQLLGYYMMGKIISNESVSTNNEIKHGKTSNEKEVFHEVIINKNSLLYDILKKEKITVSSYHNYSLNPKYTKSFKTISSAKDGIIEAIEPKTPWNKFVLGVQWHPEIPSKNIKDSSKIFQAFINAIKN